MLRATHIEFSDVATSGATDVLIKSSGITLMSFDVSNGMTIKKHLSMHNNALGEVTSISATTDTASGRLQQILGIFHQRSTICTQ